MSNFLDNKQMCPNPFVVSSNYKCYSLVNVGGYSLYRYEQYYDNCRNGSSYSIFKNGKYLFPIKVKTAQSCIDENALISLIEFKQKYKRLPHKGDILKRKKLDFDIQLPINL